MRLKDKEKKKHFDIISSLLEVHGDGLEAFRSGLLVRGMRRLTQVTTPLPSIRKLALLAA